MKKVVMSMAAVGMCLLSQTLLVEDASACSCKEQTPGVRGIYPNNGNLPANAKGITIAATHWPRTTRVVPKSAYKIQLMRTDGKTRKAVDFELRYLGPIEGKDTAKRKKSQKRAYLEQLQANLYLVKPTKGFKAGGTYQLVVDRGRLIYRPRRRGAFSPLNGTMAAGQARHSKGPTQPGRIDKRPGRRQNIRTYTIDKKKLKAPRKPGHPAITVEKQTLKLPGGARCIREKTVMAASIDMKPPEAYKNALIYGVFVDGQLWKVKRSLCSSIRPGRSGLADLGKEVVFNRGATCKDRTIQAVAMLPGTKQVWWFKSKKVAFGCEKPTPTP